MSLSFNFQPYIEKSPLPKKIKQELSGIFSSNLSRPYSRTRVSAAPLGIKTQRSRVINLIAIFIELWKDKFEVQSIYGLKEKHVEHLLKKWKEEGQTRGTIENKLTYLATLAAWTRRPNVVKRATEYEVLNDIEKRSGVTSHDKSWTGAGVNVSEVLNKILVDNKYVGIQLLMAWAFGLRVEESMLIRPFDALLQVHGELYVTIANGTKGGRQRRVDLHDFDKQLSILELAKPLVNRKSKTTIPLEYSLTKWKNKFYGVLRKHGVTKTNLGVTAHGLRHQFLNDLYEHLTNLKSPIRGGEMPEEDVYSMARQVITETAGHSMESKANAYIGSHRALKSKVAADLTDQEILQKLRECDGNKMKTAEALGCARSFLYKRLAKIDSPIDREALIV